MLKWLAKRLVSATTFAACSVVWMFIFGWTLQEWLINFSVGLAAIGWIRAVFDVDIIGYGHRLCESRQRETVIEDGVASVCRVKHAP